jgi:hypothetical protein
MSRIEFRGSIANVQNALKFGSQIGRITFEVPQQEVENAIGLVALQQTPLKITVEIDDEYSQRDHSQSKTSDDKKTGGQKTAGKAVRREWLCRNKSNQEAGKETDG